MGLDGYGSGRESIAVVGDQPEALVARYCGNAGSAIGACGGDLLATVRSLVVANNFLLAQNQALSAELDYAWRWISPGYTRSTNKRRMRTGDPD